MSELVPVLKVLAVVLGSLVFFLVNLVLTSSFFVYLEQGLVVSDSERIRQEFYRTHRIGLEITAAMPLEILLLVPALAKYSARVMTAVVPAALSSASA